ncbi:MAG: hypothetical protein QM731_17655 [Chitinophagaceae bacterium]
MSLKKFNPRTIILFVIMVVVAAVRVLLSWYPNISPMSNFTPLAAMALFGGAYFSKGSKAYLFPIITLWLGDILLNRFIFYHEWRLLYDGWYWTYGSFALMTLTGRLMIKKATVANVGLSAIVATFIHWIGTSPACLLIEGSMYPRTFSGWITSLVAAIPYEWNMLLSTLIFCGILFGGFELLQRRYHSLQPAKLSV